VSVPEFGVRYLKTFMAKITIDGNRVLHLIFLLLSSYIVGSLIEYFFSSFSTFSAYALAVTMVCQINSGLQQVWELRRISSSSSEFGEVEDADTLKLPNADKKISRNHTQRNMEKKNK
jgi:hypothetical protein